MRHWLAGFLLLIGLSVWMLPRQQVDDLVYFGGDSWEYQAMAVNAAHGHGLRVGAVLPLEAYKFSSPAETPELEADFLERGRRPEGYNTYRTPAFPAFAALLYRLFGDSPRVVYRAQLVLLLLAASALPALGFAAAGRAGLLAGAVAGLLTGIVHAKVADTFLTEVLILAYLVALHAAFLWFATRPTPPRAAGFGLLAGAGLLVKGSLIFVPALLALGLAAARWRGRLGGSALLAALLGMALLPAAWSVHVSRVAGRPVFVSTQGNRVLLDGNNELGFADGGWHPEWDGRRRAFQDRDPPAVDGLYYNRPEVRARPVWRQVAGFLASHPAQAAVLLLNKVGAAYTDLPGVRLWAGVWCLLALRDTLLRRLPRRLAGTAAAGLAALALALAPSDVYAVTGLWVLAAAAAWAWVSLRGLPESRPPLPATLALLPLNFLLLTLLTFGLRRFTLPADPLFWTGAGIALLHAARLLRGDLRSPRGAA